MKAHGSYITFKVSGRTIPANNGVIGIDSQLKVFEGYDGNFCEFEETLTCAEEKELADYMIGLWTQYRETI